MEKQLKQIITHFGQTAQIIKAMEEFGELTTELAKGLNGQGGLDRIAEEMADALVMIKQLMIIFDISGKDLDTLGNAKIVRTLNRIRAEKIREEERRHETDH